MLGLVLWSDPKSRKALIWCEDQSDLAYFDGVLDGADVAQAGVEDKPDGLNVGDMLMFDICHSGHFRRATNVRTLYQRAADDLVEMLRSAVGAAGQVHDSAAIPDVTNQDMDGIVVNFPCARRRSDESDASQALGYGGHA